MPRITYENPLGTLAEGLQGGLSGARQMQQLTKTEEQFDQESNETKASQQFMRGLRNLTPDQQDAASRMPKEALPYMMRYDEAQRKQAMMQQEFEQFQAEIADAMADEESGLKPEVVKQLLTQYSSEPTKGREALFEMRADARHGLEQVAMRRWGMEQVLNFKQLNPGLFAVPPAGLDRTAEQEMAQKMMEELMKIPAKRGQPGPDYIGAASVIEMLATPRLAAAFPLILKQAQEDFETWAQLMGGEMGAEPPTSGPAGVQEAISPRARMASNEQPGATGLGRVDDGIVRTKDNQRVIPEKGQKLLQAEADEQSKPESDTKGVPPVDLVDRVQSLFGFGNIARLRGKGTGASPKDEDPKGDPQSKPPPVSKVKKNPKKEEKFERPIGKGEVMHDGVRYRVVGRRTPGAVNLGGSIWGVPVDENED
jgi:hypothetical protein